MIRKSKTAQPPKVKNAKARGATPGKLKPFPLEEKVTLKRDDFTDAAPSGSGSPSVTAGGTSRIVDGLLPLAQLEPSPTNPRKHFDDVALEELAQTIRQHGILEPILVREQLDVVNGRGKVLYEIVAGERRFRAAKLAKLKEVPCRIAQLSDAQVLEIQVVENLARSDLNPIEEAIGFRQLLNTGLTQEQLAQKIGKTQAHVSDRVRLLELPAKWQERVIAGDLPASHARTLLAWKHVPRALEAMHRQLAKTETVPPLKEWERLMEGALLQVTAPLSGWNNGEWRIRPNKEQEAELGIIKVKHWGSLQNRATNTALAVKLKRELFARRKDREQTKSGKPSGKKNEPTPAELRAQAKAAAAELAEQVYAWKCEWHTQLCAQRLRDVGTQREHDATLVRLVIYALSSREWQWYGDNDAIRKLFKARDIIVKGSSYSHASDYRWLDGIWDALEQLPPPELPQFLVDLLSAMIAENDTLPKARIQPLAEKLGIDLRVEWPRLKGQDLARKFFALHSAEQLSKLADELGVYLLGADRLEAINLLADGYQTSGQPTPLPKVILDAKPPKRK